MGTRSGEPLSSPPPPSAFSAILDRVAAPDYLICLECESPCYTFEWEEGEVTEALCERCGSDDPSQFMTPDDFDALTESPT